MPLEMASHSAILYQNYAIIFGGQSFEWNIPISNKLNAFNFKTCRWTVLDNAETENELRPPPVYGHAAVKDNEEYMYIFGGETGFDENNNVNRIDLREAIPSWEKIHHSSHLDLLGYRHECVFYENMLLVFGKDAALENPMAFIDALNLGNQEWTVLQTNPDEVHGFPQSRCCFGLARFENDVYISGGVGDKLYDDVWKYSLAEKNWTKLSLTLPEPVYLHGFYINESGCMFLYGGMTNGQRNLGNLYSFWLKVPSLKHICCDLIPDSTMKSLYMNNEFEF